MIFKPREVYLRESFEILMLTQLESKDDVLQKVTRFVDSKQVSKPEAIKITRDYVNRLQSRGVPRNKAEGIARKFSTKVRNITIALLLTSVAIGGALMKMSSTSTPEQLETALQQEVVSIDHSIDTAAPVLTAKSSGKEQVKPAAKKPTEAPQEQHSVERTNYTLSNGDTFWKLTQRFKPDNVDANAYLKILKRINKGRPLVVGKDILLPSDKDLAPVTLPDVEISFDLDSPDFLRKLKVDEGDEQYQSTVKSQLLGGRKGYSFRNGKFYPYKDSRGYWTIGYGHLISKTSTAMASKYSGGITVGEANRLLKSDIQREYDPFVRMLQRKGATDLPPEIQEALFEMSFNMGTGGVSKFDNMWKYLVAGDYERAAKAMKNSNWAKQTGDRSQRIVDVVYNYSNQSDEDA